MRAARAIEGRLGQVGRVGQVRQVGVRAAQAIEGRLGGMGRVDVYTLVMGRLSFALPVSFLYRLYRVSGKRKKIC